MKASQLSLLDYAAPVPEAVPEPVPEVVEPRHLEPVPALGTDDVVPAEITSSDRFRNRLEPPVPEPIAEITSDFTVPAGSLLHREKESGTGSTDQAPLAGGGMSASLPPQHDEGCRGLEPNRDREKAVSAAGTDPEPQKRSPVLRPYQLEAISAVERQFGHVDSTLVVLPTGTGKTVCFAALARWTVSRGRRVLVLAHRTELLEQARNKLVDVGVWAAIEKADRRAGLASVVVASVQTLRGKRLAQLDAKQFGLVVVDESHHAAAASYRAILDHFGSCKILGVTATPDRADGKALGEIFDSVAYRYELRDAIRDRWLAPIVARRIVLQGVDLSSVRSRAGDLASDELAAVMATDEAVLGVVVPLLEQAGDRRTIVFAVDVAHARAITEAINARRPNAARLAHGELEDHERRQILVDYARGDFQFLVNCALYTEGFDEPSVSCVAIARPTKSRALFVQMVGRGTRLLGLSYDASVAAGKSDCLILDFTGNAGRHRLVTPIDCLAPGDVTEDVRAEAERMVKEDEVDLETVFDEAREAIEQRRREYRASATARYFAQDVDPFFGEELPGEILEAWALEPATPDERRALLDLGFKGLPPNLCKGDAKRMFLAVEGRSKKGLCSLRQAKQLARCGIDGRNMTKASASARMAILSRHDWDPNRARHDLRELDIRERSAAILNNGGES